MTIQLRINLSFVVIIVLFALNLTIYFWNNGRERVSADSLRRAIRRQLLFSDIRQEIAVYQKQIEVLSQAIGGPTGAAAASEINQFQGQLDKTSGEAHELEQLADSDTRSQFSAFARDFDALSKSWIVFYRNMGVNPSVAIKELAMRSEPLSQRVIQ